MTHEHKLFFSLLGVFLSLVMKSFFCLFFDFLFVFCFLGEVEVLGRGDDTFTTVMMRMRMRMMRMISSRRCFCCSPNSSSSSLPQKNTKFVVRRRIQTTTRAEKEKAEKAFTKGEEEEEEEEEANDNNNIIRNGPPPPPPHHHRLRIHEGRHAFETKTAKEMQRLFLHSLRRGGAKENNEEETMVSRDIVVKLSGTGKAPKQKKPEFKKSEFRPVLIKNELKVQLIRFTETQSFTKNFAVHDEEVEGILEDVVANGGYGNWRVDMRDETAYDIRVTKSGDAFVSRSKKSRSSLEGESSRSNDDDDDESKKTNGADSTKRLINTTRKNASFLANDREKKRLMRADDPFLVQVGVSTKDGKIKAAKRNKYKQVEEFLHHLEASLPVASDEEYTSAKKPLNIVDLGCGNAYLTFATYSFLKNTKSMDTNVVGVDVKRQSKEHNEAVAKELGWERDVSFVQGTIEQAEIPGSENVDVCIALHACDTATDQSLVRAVRWKTKLILASPCCHHDLHVRIKKSVTSSSSSSSSSVLLAPMTSIARHGILYERTIDNVTDAWRALVLRILGYKVDVVEFIGGEHTARNTLIRARYTGAKATKELWDEHDAMVSSFGCESYLTEALKKELESRRISVT